MAERFGNVTSFDYFSTAIVWSICSFVRTIQRTVFKSDQVLIAGLVIILLQHDRVLDL